MSYINLPGGPYPFTPDWPNRLPPISPVCPPTWPAPVPERVAEDFYRRENEALRRRNRELENEIQRLLRESVARPPLDLPLPQGW